ncbi:MAG: ABC transporter permease [Oscillospiraceae bacterium]|jgi:ABC-2 type transport system permease protein|nr:ABC transporter permease [Oscillospiraceae bacterium]
MRSIRAIYVKQAKDMFKNIPVLVQFIIYPVMALIFTVLVAKPDETIADTMFVSMFSSIFAGMALIFSASGAIAEDRESKSLRFLVMAGVKPHEYLLGVGGVLFTAGSVVSVVFALMGGYAGAGFAKFLGFMLLSCLSSILLGATIGIASKNQQAATALGTPAAMILGFGPMITMFNDTAKKIFSVFYTQQLNIAVSDAHAGVIKPLGVILANIAVLAALFALAYKRKGLRG